MRALKMGKQILNVLVSIYPEKFILNDDNVILATSNTKLPWSSDIDLQNVVNYFRTEFFSLLTFFMKEPSKKFNFKLY